MLEVARSVKRLSIGAPLRGRMKRGRKERRDVSCMMGRWRCSDSNVL